MTPETSKFSVNPELTILHVGNYDLGRIGGPHHSVLELIRAQHEAGVRVALLTRSKSDAFKLQVPYPIFFTAEMPGYDKLSRLPSPFFSPDLINFQGYYSWMNAMIAWTARWRGIPYIIAPRGSMTREAHSQKRLKKMLADILFQDRMVAQAAYIHCLTELEAEDARRWGRPVFVVANGTDLGVAPGHFQTELANPGFPLRMLFLGRLDIHHKGLDLLLQGLAIFSQNHPLDEWRVLLVGPDQRGSRVKLEAMIDRLGLVNRVKLIGPLVGLEKEEAFRESHVFIHTSRFEGQPLAVTEALAHGLPCLVTPGTNMCDQITTAKAGWCAIPTAEGVASALIEVVSDRAKLPEMGQAARTLAIREFNWTYIAKKMIKQYEVIVKTNDSRHSRFG